jgi:hypothetical protein
MSEEKQGEEQTPAARASDESLADETMESVSGGMTKIGISPTFPPIGPPPTFPDPYPILLDVNGVG